MSTAEKPLAEESRATANLPWSLSVADVVRELKTDLTQGLSDEEARNRRDVIGSNQLEDHRQNRVWQILLAQFLNVMVGLLFAAAIISGLIGDWTDSILIVGIVLANISIGFSQEWMAERAVASLKQLSQPITRVCRDSRWRDIPSLELVPGDLVEVVSGDLIPADCRLASVANLEVTEASLTGESASVEKSVDSVSAQTPVADRSCMVFAGTAVAVGHGRAVVTATARNTELGKIADLLSASGPASTPLQQQLGTLSRQLTYLVLAIMVVMFLAGVSRYGLTQMLLTSVGLAVAAVPEGLPAIITIGLAIGAKRMARRKAIIRRLTAVETLGCVDVICTDKTGTLTQNRMTVEEILPISTSPEVREQLIRSAVLCSDAAVGSDRVVVGTPTEAALLNAALNEQVDIDELRHRYARIAEIPFTSIRKRMSTLHRTPEGDHTLFVKGAIEHILPCCRTVTGTSEEPSPESILESTADFARRGQRVLGFATRHWPASESPPQAEEWERELTFLGLISLTDPIRPEVPEAIHLCKSAGIRVILITGDHPETARSIAQQIQLWEPGDALLTGMELEQLSDANFSKSVTQASVFARVSPEHKLRIIRCHQANGSVTAMTGDGVNDAPALQQADIGVAMGRTGTDVAKDAAGMILADDNFATIVAAVEEGRTVYNNIRKSIVYLITGNLAEVALLFVAILVGLPLPLLPIHILWINLVTDGLPALAMAFEPAEAGVMLRAPRGRIEPLLRGRLLQTIASISALIAAACFGLFIFCLNIDSSGAASDASITNARTAVFMTLALSQLFFAVSARDLSQRASLSMALKNYRLVIAIVVGVGLQFAICFHPVLQRVFHTSTLPLSDLALAIGASCLPYMGMEFWKRTWSLNSNSHKEPSCP